MVLDVPALTIGLCVGGVVLLAIILIVVACCCCRKCEKGMVKMSFKREDKKYQQDRAELTEEQMKRKEDILEKHDEIRRKYGIGKYAGRETDMSGFDEPNYSYSVQTESVSKN